MKTIVSFLFNFIHLLSKFSLHAQNNNVFGVKQTQGILSGILLGGAIGEALGSQKEKSILDICNLTGFLQVI